MKLKASASGRIQFRLLSHFLFSCLLVESRTRRVNKFRERFPREVATP
jgi:hypothetical protein